MENEVLIAVLSKIIEEKLSSVVATPGPRGLRGHDGRSGKDFDFLEHSETIKKWAVDAALKFEDFTSEQIDKIKGPKGSDGRDGKDGKDFDFEEYSATIKAWTLEAAIKFEDLTSGQINSLRGADGKDGRDGRDFDFDSNKESIDTLIRSAVDAISERLKLKFSDLTEEEIGVLRGPRGRDGRDGRDFIFDEHVEFFKTLKLKFSDLTEEERESLTLRFSKLTQEEKDSLKLCFNHLTEDDRAAIRGPRGGRGQKGSPGREGEAGIAGVRGIRGLPGPQGITGTKGINGRDGIDGQDAPYVIGVSLEENKDEIYFVFEFSDGSIIETNSVELPDNSGIRYIFGGGGSSSNSGGTVNVGFNPDDILTGPSPYNYSGPVDPLAILFDDSGNVIITED